MHAAFIAIMCMLQVVCQDKKIVVAEAKTSCEQLLVAIVQDKRIADEQEKQVCWLVFFTHAACVQMCMLDQTLTASVSNFPICVACLHH